MNPSKYNIAALDDPSSSRSPDCLSTLTSESQRPALWKVRLAALFFMGWAFCVLASLGCQPTGTLHTTADRIREGKVVGGSMAPNFLGEHFKFQCKSCNSDVVADYDQAKTRRELVCPFCGAATPLSNCQPQSSDRVQIELGSDSIERWDVVAFRVPGTEEAGIKRVVGLPGESIEIRAGNLWSDGRMLHKPLDEQVRTRILVHDSHKTPLAPIAWQAVDTKGGRLGSASHRFEDDQFRVLGEPEADGQPVMCWFEFCNHRNYAHRLDMVEKEDCVPIQDSYGYNQSIFRDLNTVGEVFVALQFNPKVARQIGWRFQHGHGSLSFEIDVEEQQLLIERSPEFSGEPKVRVELAAGLLKSSKTEVQFSTIDATVLVLISGKEVARFNWRPVESSNSEHFDDQSINQIQIGAAVEPGLGEARPIDRVRIWRDIYYLPTPGGQDHQLLVGAADGYLLLGDNQPVSIDSRNWNQTWVSSDQIIGKVRK